MDTSSFSASQVSTNWRNQLGREGSRGDQTEEQGRRWWREREKRERERLTEKGGEMEGTKKDDEG